MFTRSRRIVFILFSTALALASPHPGPAASPAWPHAHSDLSPDPRVIYGRLENDFRYMILPHANPAGRVTLHLLVEAGSYHENADELGLAHFVEHMVFNGSRDFPGDDTIKTLQRLGLEFGPDANAYTTMLETGYRLENLRVADPTALATGLKILRNIADGALFSEPAVRKERKVILAEARARAGAMAFAWRRELEFLPPYPDEYTGEEIAAVFSGTRIEERINPMGSEKIIAKATADQLHAFYTRWYRPGHMILAVVGDIDPSAAETLITSTFSSLRARSPAPTPPAASTPIVYDHAGPHLFATNNPDLPQVHLTLTSAVPRNTADDSSRLTAELPARFALSLIAERIEHSLKIPVQVDSVHSHAVPGWQLPLLRIATPAAHWNASAVAMIEAVRRAQQHGFSPAEIEQHKKSYQRARDEDARDAPNRTAAELARALVFSASRNAVFTSASTELGANEAALAAITPAACLDAARSLWPDTRTTLAIRGPIAEKDFQNTKPIGDAWAAKFDPLPETAIKPFPYSDFGPPGTVASQHHDEALDCWFVQFANGVRLNVKSLQSGAGQIKIQINFGHGSLGANRTGLGMAIGALIFGGLHELPFEDFGPTFKQSQSHIAEFAFGWTEDHFKFSESVDDRNLPLGLQIVTAFLTAPAFRASAEPMMRGMFEPQLAPHEQNASEAADYASQNLLYGHHPSVQMPTIAESRQIPFATLRDSITPQLLNSPLEVTLVGDLSPEAAIAIVARTLGTLPPRPTADPLASRRTFTPPAPAARETVHFKGNNNIGSIALAWTMPNETGYHDDCCAVLLSSIIEDRLRLTLRQEMGETYSPSVNVWTPTSLTPPTLSIRARVETAPKHVERVAKAMRKVVDQLAREGATADELERARQPSISTTETNLTQIAPWLDALAEAQSKPQYLVGYAGRLSFYRTITRDEINSLARTLLVNNRSSEVRALPE